MYNKRKKNLHKEIYVDFFMQWKDKIKKRWYNRLGTTSESRKNKENENHNTRFLEITWRTISKNSIYISNAKHSNYNNRQLKKTQ